MDELIFGFTSARLCHTRKYRMRHVGQIDHGGTRSHARPRSPRRRCRWLCVPSLHPFASKLVMAYLLDTPRRPRSTESRATKKAKRENAAVAFQRSGIEFALIRIIHDQLPPTFSLRTI